MDNGKGRSDNHLLVLGLFLTTTFFYWVALYLYVPDLPTYVQDRTADLSVVGTVLAMYGLWQALARLPLGVAVDRWSREKLFIICGLSFAAIGALIMMVGRTAFVLGLGRAVTGLAAATWVPLVAAYSGLHKAEHAVLATSLMSLSRSLGRVAATAVSGVLVRAGGVELPFILAAVAAGLAVATIAVTPLRRTAPGGATLRDAVRLIGRRDVILPSLASTVLLFGVWLSIFGFVPILAQELSGGAVVKGLIVAANLAAGVVGNILSTALARGPRRGPSLIIGYSALCLGIAMTAIAPGLFVLFVAVILIGFSQGSLYPTLMGMSMEHVDQSRRTIAMGVHQSVYAVGMFGGPWLGGIVAELVGVRWMFGIMAAGTTVLALVLIPALLRGGRTVPETAA